MIYKLNVQKNFQWQCLRACTTTGSREEREEAREEREGLDIYSKHLVMSGLRGVSPAGGGLRREGRFVKYFLILFFCNLENKGVYYGVGLSVLFYLMRESCEPTAAENDDCEVKS